MARAAKEGGPALSRIRASAVASGKIHQAGWPGQHSDETTVVWAKVAAVGW